MAVPLTPKTLAINLVQNRKVRLNEGPQRCPEGLSCAYCKTAQDLNYIVEHLRELVLY